MNARPSTIPFTALVITLCCVQQLRAQKPKAAPLPRCMMPAADTTGARQQVTATIAPVQLKLPAGFKREGAIVDSSTGSVIQRETWSGQAPPSVVSLTRIHPASSADWGGMDFGTPSQHVSACVDSIGGLLAAIVTDRQVTPPASGADSLVVYSTVGRFALGPTEFIDIRTRPTATLAGQQALLPIIFSVRLPKATRPL
jgi:hypothetical protein